MAMTNSRFQIYRDKAGQWRWRLRAGNHRIIADSGEGYSRRDRAEKAVALVQAEAFLAEVEEQA
jgi:uncharacterized protein